MNSEVSVVVCVKNSELTLKNCLESVKNNFPLELIVVDGGSNNVSLSISNKYADKIYITDDNPRNENPSKIRKNILKYCSRAMEVSDRRKAIKLAIKELKMNEILIVAGKGHEKFQVLKNKTIKFDDFTVVKQLLN